MYLCINRSKPRNHGFTLIEIVVSLIICGFIAMMIGNGLVYSVQLYKTVKVTDEIIPQTNTAINIIKKEIATELSEGNINDNNIQSCNFGRISYTGTQLKLNNNTLLHNVSSCRIEKKAFTTSNAQIYHIYFTLNLNDSNKTFEFDVCGE